MANAATVSCAAAYGRTNGNRTGPYSTVLLLPGEETVCHNTRKCVLLLGVDNLVRRGQRVHRPEQSQFSAGYSYRRDMMEQGSLAGYRECFRSGGQRPMPPAQFASWMTNPLEFRTNGMGVALGRSSHRAPTCVLALSREHRQLGGHGLPHRRSVASSPLVSWPQLLYPDTNTSRNDHGKGLLNRTHTGRRFRTKRNGVLLRVSYSHYNRGG